MSTMKQELFAANQAAALALLKDGVAAIRYTARYFTPSCIVGIAKGELSPDATTSGLTICETLSLSECETQAVQWARKQAGIPASEPGFTAADWLGGILIVSTTVRAFPVSITA
jgi:hypothetical protein